MKISYKWLSELVDLSGVRGPQALADLLTSRGLEVEAIERQDQGLEKVVTAQILERAPHPQADRLSLCKVSLGSGEPIEIVCGAQNMKAGDKVALAQVGADLPNGIKIAQSKIRGVVSNGMLCSEEELKLAEKSEGILILSPSTPLGRPLAEILGRDDTVLTFKLTANRGDCLSHYGMAREVAAALGKTAKRPEALPLQFAGPAGGISIELNAGEDAPQFYGCMIEGVKIGPSPDWVVKRLEAVGSRSINNVVDATNLLMLELGQPVHAYDAALIRGGKIQVRIAHSGEEFPLLDGSSVKCGGTELVIADGQGAIGLAGVMGGGNSEVRDTTTQVYLECAEFSPSKVRKASSKHQKKTDAAHRFERGVDPEGVPYAIARLARLVTELAGGKITGAQAVRGPSRDWIGQGEAQREIKTTPRYFADFLGMVVTPAEAEKVLNDLGCVISKNGEDWSVYPPSYRLDLSIPEDLAEEVARSLGYERILESVPVLEDAPAALEEGSAWARLKQLDRAKDILKSLGFQESLNFAFTSKQWLSELGFTTSPKLVNPLSDEYEALVPAILPGLIKNALDNTRKHFGSEALAIRLFEIRPSFSAPEEIRSSGEMETNVTERWKLSLVLSGPRYAQALRTEQGEVDFSDLKAVFESLFDQMGARGIRLQPMGAFPGAKPLQTAHLFHPGKTAEIVAGKEIAGYFGLLHPGVSRNLKLRAPLWIAELDWEALRKLSRPANQSAPFKAWSEFPPIERDFALLVRSEVTADKITQLALKAGKPLAKIAKVFDVYRGSQIQEGMTSVAVRVIFYEENRSLQESEAESASAQILSTWKKELGAELRG